MKIKLFIIASIILLASIGILKVQNDPSSNLVLAAIEALASPENGGDNNYWTQPQTVSCKLDLGNGWFTASVERQCVFCAVPYSCTEVACGDVFY